MHVTHTRPRGEISSFHTARGAPACRQPSNQQKEKNMTAHQTGTREEWLAARLRLLEMEKEHTRRGDELSRLRQELPWVKMETGYRFETEAGPATLAGLFRGRSQLLVYHFMFGPDYEAGCPSCSAIADGFNGIAIHLANHDVMFTAISLAPLQKLLAFRRRMGWSFPWASSAGSGFNFDFHASFTGGQQAAGIDYNFRREPGSRDEPDDDEPGPVSDLASACGVDRSGYVRQRPGMSAFLLDEGEVYHTYSTYARGLDALWGMYSWLDRAPRGRNESGIWWRHHDRYDAGSADLPTCCNHGTGAGHE
jgi:predicted dithiol-disulfide oxidoreductase (DUF899 family)